MLTSLHLQESRKLITFPENWCKGDLARTNHNVRTSPWGTTASQWCMIGAFCHVSARDGLLVSTNKKARDFLQLAIAELFPSYDLAVARFNDSHTHQQVLQVYDLAIAKALEAEKEAGIAGGRIK